MKPILQAVHPVLGAIEVAESVRFYQSLGFAVIFQDAPTNPRYAAVRRDVVELHIQWAGEEQWAYPTDHSTAAVLQPRIRVFRESRSLHSYDAKPLSRGRLHHYPTL
jgi:hypothetical protein